jgi:hypothetical protein
VAQQAVACEFHDIRRKSRLELHHNVFRRVFWQPCFYQQFEPVCLDLTTSPIDQGLVNTFVRNLLPGPRCLCLRLVLLAKKLLVRGESLVEPPDKGIARIVIFKANQLALALEDCGIDVVTTVLKANSEINTDTATTTPSGADGGRRERPAQRMRVQGRRGNEADKAKRGPIDNYQSTADAMGLVPLTDRGGQSCRVRARDGDCRERAMSFRPLALLMRTEL